MLRPLIRLRAGGACREVAVVWRRYAGAGICKELLALALCFFTNEAGRQRQSQLDARAYSVER